MSEMMNLGASFLAAAATDGASISGVAVIA
jgi:hypothetical protein